MTCLMLLGIWLVDHWLQFLWAPDPRLLFDWLLFKWIFDVADGSVVTCFLLYGGYKTVRVYIGAEQ